ncbi:glycosyl transferase family 2 [Pseudodesulfovibrio sp. F-1]|uniref:Glycosyl transferase family 2 n=1 Tax=Pseudodesulfovibrio alkaliphilus TaxID=2661613 RepID=A0A7K1KJG1_9BACT|nr:glycosyl transferase family 2 [Pseudodesulfovibrio alkaliphilus]MUM76131.1 glycosyl transferase family 2 [Pseudodesulfovibrio alkaliphilus]
MSVSLLATYTDAVLDFALGAPPSATPIPRPAKPSDEDIAAFVRRTLRLAEKSGADRLVLLGLGSGAIPAALKAAMPETMALTVCEMDPDAARAFLDANPDWRDSSERACVIADASPWAQLCLLALSGANAQNSATALTPDLEATDRARLQSLQRLFVSARPHQALNSALLSHVAVQAPDLSVGVILSPDEPGLDDFFGQFPDWVREVVVIWDAENIPDRAYACAAPMRHLARPLDDFATQRNHMLAHCSGDWVLYLDGDECFSQDVWSLFTALMLIKRLEACYFPRMTLYPDESRCKVGFGLWPDLQLRLFRNRPGLRFERPVHERLCGISGRTALALDAPILHLSRIRKTPEQLAAKLERFRQAGGPVHRLNSEYPHLPRTLFPEAAFISGALQTLLLEDNPA